MRLSGLALVALLAVASAARAQTIPRTLSEAEAEGAQFARDAAGAAQAGWAARPFRGTRERRCAGPSTADDSLQRGSLPLRSGDLLIRAWFAVPLGFRVNERHKILWLPLHARTNDPTPLLIRAVRLGHPSDSLRLTVAKLARSRTEFGYPSTVSFPSLGEWLVVATAGADWGCFLFTVASSQSDQSQPVS
jgi:hypothetical protein